MKTLLFLLPIVCMQFVQFVQFVQGGQNNCNSELADKIVSFESNNWRGYQVGLHEKRRRGGTTLDLSLVWAGQSLRPDTLWMAEQCRGQLCFSRYKYDAKEMGDYFKEIVDEKNYFYMQRFGGLRVDHVWTHDLDDWKNAKPSESASFFPGFDVFCDKCDRLKYCTVVTKKNDIDKWNRDKIGKMMATSDGWVRFEEFSQNEKWTITVHDKNKIPDWYLGPNSALSVNISSVLSFIVLYYITKYII
eukprot:GFUD01091231.1.p1 GENE.GFUD01091231.1~~GFUD01091231.1.p1  ORF type:complete len:246 (-),score=55.08 GFUD01091231.1:43-780(-)